MPASKAALGVTRRLAKTVKRGPLRLPLARNVLHEIGIRLKATNRTFVADFNSIHQDTTSYNRSVTESNVSLQMESQEIRAPKN